MKTQILTIATLTLFSAGSLAHAHNWKDRIGSNSLSDEPRGVDSPELITTPPNGYPGGSMSVGVDSGGNGFAYRADAARMDRADRNAKMRRGKTARVRHDWVEDETVYRSSAPASDNTYFAAYGEDIPALRGLQLETAVNRLHHINRKEIDLAKMGESRAKSAHVLNLAHQIRADHEKLENKVTALAKRRNINLESFQLATYEQAVKDRLDNLNGAEFETAFLRVMERGHDEAAAALRTVRNDLSDTEVRGLINEALPQMAAHRTTVLKNKARASVEDGDLGE